MRERNLVTLYAMEPVGLRILEQLRQKHPAKQHDLSESCAGSHGGLRIWALGPALEP